MKRLFVISMILLTAHFVVAKTVFRYLPDKNLEKAKAGAPYDVIIVPGIPYDSTTGWDRLMQARVLWAKYLYDEGIAKNIIFSGSAVYTPYYESKIMAMYAIALGLPEANVFTEEKAEHSTENLYYSYLLAQKKGFKKIALATDPFQNLMLKSFRRRENLDVTLIPIVFKILETVPHPELKIDAERAKVESFTPLEEREGFFKRFKGTLGLRLNERL